MLNLTEKDIVVHRAKERFAWDRPLITNKGSGGTIFNGRLRDAFGFRWKLPHGRVINIEVQVYFMGFGRGNRERFVLDTYVVQPNLTLYPIEKGVEVWKELG